MATSKSQRITIWVIAVVLAIGTIGSFYVIILASNNEATDREKQQADYQKLLEDYQKQQKEAASENAQNSEALEGYSARTFDADSVEKLSVDVIRQGDGAVIQDSDSIRASYFGWTSDGVIFDSSNKKDADNEPITFSLSGVIEGWTKGIAGQKEGAVLRLTIPSDQAYGSNGSGIIPADAPLEFIVEVHSIDNSEQ